MDIMKHCELILASASPRRHEILEKAGLKHRIVTAPADESGIKYTANMPELYVTDEAQLKNNAVRDFMSANGTLSGTVILSADTIVYDPETDTVLGKPKDTSDAERMLAALSGRSHRVMTGVVLYRADTDKTLRFCETTEVKFRTLSPHEIHAYCESGDPLDKAGAYGMQSGACIFVEGIVGDYYNVVGLPVCKVYEALKSI